MEIGDKFTYDYDVQINNAWGEPGLEHRQKVGKVVNFTWDERTGRSMFQVEFDDKSTMWFDFSKV